MYPVFKWLKVGQLWNDQISFKNQTKTVQNSPNHLKQKNSKWRPKTDLKKYGFQTPLHIHNPNSNRLNSLI